MENSSRRKNSSGDKFSFPVIQDPDFEFGSCVTPTSPADHLFSNGRLLPHAFPLITQPSTTTTNNIYTITRSSSRTSTTSSKDSLVSSRSNSTNSRSSSCSTSARTSTSTESSDQRRPFNQPKVGGTRDKCRAVLAQQYYGSSQRWQFIAPAPVLNHQVSRRRKTEIEGKKAEERSGFGWRFFRSVVSACKECHAIKPSN